MWHGLQPHISSASSLQRLSEFYEGENLGELVAMTEIQRQVARNIISLDDLSVRGSQLSLVQLLDQELDAIRKRFANCWSSAAEINLQGAKLLFYAHFLLFAEDQESEMGKEADVHHFICTVLQRGHSAALELIKVIQDLGLASTSDPPCVRTEDGGSPLLAHPKQHFRLAFFACVFLLKYVDYGPTTSSTDQDAARNGVATVFQVFKQFVSREEILRATRTIEVLGRSIVPGERRVKTMIKTRMGASLSYNAIWTAAKLRGREQDPEYTVTPSTSGAQVDAGPGTDTLEDLGSMAMEQVPTTSSIPLVPAFEQAFPWGIWDDAAFDELGFQLDEHTFPGLTGSMNNF